MAFSKANYYQIFFVFVYLVCVLMYEWNYLASFVSTFNDELAFNFTVLGAICLYLEEEKNVYV